jgi:23S rRNA pseudouridine1911/1915/1917 synthase
MIAPEKIFEDEKILVLSKPSGLVVNDSESERETVQRWVSENFKFQISNDRTLRSGIVHRLDKETSGVLLVAKDKETFENLQTQFRMRKVRKKYIALVHGRVDPLSGGGEGVINKPVGRLPWKRTKFGVLDGGREAVTNYKVLRYYDTRILREKYTLLEVEPKTGRTHQIRIHLKYIGHPIVSDLLYAGRKVNRSDRKWCPRMFLHAFEISFIHPNFGKNVTFKSELPPDLANVIEMISKTL